MEQALSQSEWIVGNSFSLADASLAPYFQTLSQFGWTALYDRDCPGVVDWFKRCQQRVSYQSAVTDDFPAILIDELKMKGAAVWHKIAVHLT